MEGNVNDNYNYHNMINIISYNNYKLCNELLSILNPNNYVSGQ